MADRTAVSDATQHALVLAQAAEAVRAAPSHLGALTWMATTLESGGHKDPCARAFATLCALAREQGDVALAIAALKKLEGLGEGAAQGLRSAIVSAYALGSARLVDGHRPRPPQPPSAPLAPPPAGAVTDRASAVKKAQEALVAAEKGVAALEQQRGKLAAVPLLSILPPASLDRLIAVMQLEERAAGDIVMDAGQEARSLYMVARGTVRISRGPLELGQLRVGAFFGEIALLQGTRRTARVTCQDPTWLLQIPKGELEEVAKTTPALADTLATYARTRLLGNVMRTSEIFRRLSPTDREHLVPRFESRLVPPGAFLLTEGEESERLHVIVSGEVEVRRGGQTLARLTAGEVFGEISLLARKPATADVVTVSPTVTLSLDRRRFDDVALRHPELLAEIYKLLIQREGENREKAYPEPTPVEPDRPDHEEDEEWVV
jgi:CRP-like cAMP-binding protein